MKDEGFIKCDYCELSMTRFYTGNFLSERRFSCNKHADKASEKCPPLPGRQRYEMFDAEQMQKLILQRNGVVAVRPRGPYKNNKNNKNRRSAA